jgi:hypothetical protein
MGKLTARVSDMHCDWDEARQGVPERFEEACWACSHGCTERATLVVNTS